MHGNYGISPALTVSILYRNVTSVYESNEKDPVFPVGLFEDGFVIGPSSIEIESPLATAAVKPLPIVIVLPLIEQDIG